MKIFTERSLAGAQIPAFSVARDVIRVVIAAVVAGTGFALLLALIVLSLTVIAPPAQASGAPPATTSESVPGPGSGLNTTGKQEAIPAQAEGQAMVASAAAADLPQVPAHERIYDSLPKSGTTTPTVLYLLLALATGFLAFFAYSLVKRKS